jgi:hypothetical protein
MKTEKNHIVANRYVAIADKKDTTSTNAPKSSAIGSSSRISRYPTMEKIMLYPLVGTAGREIGGLGMNIVKRLMLLLKREKKRQNLLLPYRVGPK